MFERGAGPKPIRLRRMSAETLAEEIETAVTDDEIRARTTALGEKIRAEDGIGNAIVVVTQYMQRPRRPRPLVATDELRSVSGPSQVSHRGAAYSRTDEAAC